MNTYQLHTESFIIRIWREGRELSNQADRWRGVVQAVGSDERVYFQSFAQMLEFIRQRIGPEAVAALNDQIQGNETGTN